MKPRHAAALALVGWYLMLPPWRVIGGEVRSSVPDPDASLSKWINVRNFDTAASCDHALMQFLDAAGDGEPLSDRNRARFARCIATDDPRLKPN
jgi:hypothetical protein